MSRRRGVRARVGGEHLSFSWRIGCTIPGLLIFLALGLGTYYLVKP